MHTAVSAEEPPPTGFLAAVLWPVYLYFRPDTFFRMFGRLEIPGLHTFYALIVGFAAAADRYDSRMAVSQLGGTSTTIQDNWGFFWGVVAVSGLISSLLYVYIGGWWYRMRLRFSGDKTAEPKAVRHLYILSWLPFAVPMLIDKALDTMRYTRPSESHNAPFNVMDGLIIACLVWSIWIGFRGVRTLFDTRPVRAAVWFLVLPLLFYAVIFLGAMVAAALLMMNGSPPPAVAMPSTLSSQTWRFDHPANWFIDDTHPDHNPDNFVVVSPIQDAVFIADLQEGATATAEEYVEEKLGMLRLNYGFVQPEAPLTSWGAFTGVGHVLRIQEGPDVYAGRVFAAEAGAERVLIILEMWPTAETKLLAPGFDLIERSFAIHP